MQASGHDLSPDKSKNDRYATAREVRLEALEVLTNPARKENHLQERWYNQSIRKKTTSENITPVTILKMSLELEKHVQRTALICVVIYLTSK